MSSDIPIEMVGDRIIQEMADIKPRHLVYGERLRELRTLAKLTQFELISRMLYKLHRSGCGSEIPRWFAVDKMATPGYRRNCERLCYSLEHGDKILSAIQLLFYYQVLLQEMEVKEEQLPLTIWVGMSDFDTIDPDLRAILGDPECYAKIYVKVPSR